MSITLSIPFPDGPAEIGGAGERRQVGLAYVVGIAWVQPLAGADTPKTRMDAEHRNGEAIDIEPQVYCRRRGAEHAARGFSPCSDLGCAGCGAKD